MRPDDLDPHCPAGRFRIYRRRGSDLVCVAAVTDAEAVVAAIIDQRDPEGGATLRDSDAVGILDCHGFREHNPLDEWGNYTLPGSWVVKPWVAGVKPWIGTHLPDSL